MDFNSWEEKMKQYRIVKAWPGVEVGKVFDVIKNKCFSISDNQYFYGELDKMLAEGWIEEVSERKTLNLKLYQDEYFGKLQINSMVASKIAKDHYLGLLDEAVEVWHKQRPDGELVWFLRKYLESEGKI